MTMERVFPVIGFALGFIAAVAVLSLALARVRRRDRTAALAIWPAAGPQSGTTPSAK
jgi:biotin transporter BioY